MPEVNEQELRGIERELSQLLAVDPSPEFAAKVRAAIRQQPTRGSAWWPWAVASLAAAAVIVTAIVIVSRKAPAGQLPTVLRADVHLPPGEDAPQAPAPDRMKPFVTDVARIRRAVRSPEPEILIDPSLARAVRRLAKEQPVLPELPPEPSLDPVVLEPLRVPDVSEIGSVRLQADQRRR
jgi:hypothetical protein